MTKTLKVCIDKVLPSALRDEAQRRAIQENPANLPGLPLPGEPAPPVSIAVLKNKLWAPGRTLRVRFLGGSAALQKRVQEKAMEWLNYANIKFDFGNHAQAEIRIAFTPDGSWSWIGTDALAITNQDEPTMNYGWLTTTSTDEEVSRVVLHEFGHALGCIHEHQHPKREFQWDVEAVMKYYTGPPNNWTPAEVKFNVLDRYSAAVTNASAFDPHSIMLYPVPQKFTIGDYEIPWSNSVLSETDKTFIRTQYPASS